MLGCTTAPARGCTTIDYIGVTGPRVAMISRSPCYREPPRLTPETPGSMSLLPDAAAFRRLVDGSARGPAAAAARGCLAALAAPYAVAVAARNAAYDAGMVPIGRVPVPVISIGNLTLGGTGKTPLVAWTTRLLAAAGRRPAIVSRGYAAAAGATSDEAAELALLVPGVPHVADRDRVAAAARAAAAGADCVVLDDGFQHRRLARDLDVVAVDATDPFGCGRIFPRGLLREPLTGLGRSDAVVLTRADAVDAERRHEIRAALAAVRRTERSVVWAESEHAPVALRRWTAGPLPLDSLRGRRVLAFAAVGNPAAFRATLSGLGADVVDFRAFADHHAYGPADLAALAAQAAAERADLVATTLKDLVKVRRDDLDGVPLAAVEIAIRLTAGEVELATLIRDAAERRG
jgi:tetraacyldisaccharide 4'-kinase